MTSFIVTKVRRLTMRIRKAGEPAKADDETGAATIVGHRARANGTTAPKPRRERRRRQTVLVGHEFPAAAGVTDPIERLVAEARERVLMMSRKTGSGLAQPTVLGRLAATGEISRRQCEAGRRYAEIVCDHDALLGRATGDGTSSDPDARSAHRMAMARYDSCRAALREAGREDRMAAAVADAVAVNDWELPELTPSLRIGLNHLARALDAMGEAPAATGWFAALTGPRP